MAKPTVDGVPAPHAPPHWWRGLLAGLVACLLLLLGQVADDADPRRWSAPLAASSLGHGPASLTVRDPVRALVVDMTEHLPGHGQAAPLPPLPLHPPLDAPGQLALDEAQGGELPLRLPRQADAQRPSERHPPHADASFLSAAARRRDRPPTDTDLPRA